MENNPLLPTGAGAYSLSALVGDQTILASKDGYNLYATVHSLASGSNTIDINLTSQNSTSLSGTITTSTLHLPVVGATVTILNPDNSLSSLIDVTDVNGHYQLPTVPQGNVYLRVSSDDYTNFTEGTYIFHSDKVRDMEFTTYTVTYDGNGFTSGTVPVSAEYSEGATTGIRAAITAAVRRATRRVRPGARTG